MNPDFQRDFIWSEDKQSKLIESLLLRIPLPVFYLAEDDQGGWWWLMACNACLPSGVS